MASTMVQAPSANGPSAPQGGGAVLACPVCGILVKLPATECPKCRADLRTGERPEEYVPLWRRKKTKLIILLLIRPSRPRATAC